MENSLNNNNISSRIYFLPNLFTIAALFSAFYAITEAFNSRFETAAIAVFICMILDGVDGRVARFTKTQSHFGEQLDSIADMVSFGVAPALIIYMWELKYFGKIGYSAAFIFCACAALRLALFNTTIGKVDKKWFIGIPSPTAAALLAGFLWIQQVYKFPYVEYIALYLTLFAGFSMIVKIPFWSFKELSGSRVVPFYVLILIILVLLMISWEPSLALFSFFLLYSLSGYVYAAWNWLKKDKKKNTDLTK